MPSSHRQWSIAALAFVGVLLVLAVTAPSARAAAPSSDVLTICPALGTAPVTTLAGERACVQNDCVSLERAATGTSAACDAATTPTTYVMSIAPTETVVPTADPIAGSLPAVTPAGGTTWQDVTIRALVAVGFGALLLAGALFIGSGGVPRTRRSARALLRRRPAETA